MNSWSQYTDLSLGGFSRKTLEADELAARIERDNRSGRGGIYENIWAGYGDSQNHGQGHEIKLETVDISSDVI